MKKFHSTLLAVTLSAITAPVLAYESGDILVRAGAALVAPNDDSSSLYLNGGNIGGGAGVEEDTQLGLTLTYLLTPHWGVELLGSTPFKHDINANTPALAGGAEVPAGSTKHLPPTLSLQYFLRGNEQGIQPYLGVGLNHTIFFEEDVSDTLEGGAGFNTSGTLKLEDSWGVAFQAGLDIPLGEQLFVNAAVWYVDIDTEATFNFNGTKVTTDVEIDPWVYMLSLGMKF